ncbi:MAG: arginine repressor [Acidobacteria bacterium]|nr:arginine repressor [Acidobacteriota bacterium]
MMKGTRHGVIRDVIQRESITSQEMLRQRLRAEGVEVTQATLSRDLREMGVVKRASDGAYQRLVAGSLSAGDAIGALQRTTAEFLLRVDRSEQLVVLRTDSGQAALLAIAIDRAALTEVLGTVAGDDTILVICRGAEAAEAFLQRLETWRSGASLRVAAFR